MKKKSTVASYLGAIGNVASSIYGAVRSTADETEPEVTVSFAKRPNRNGKYTCGFAKSALVPDDSMANHCIAGYNIGAKMTGIYDLCYAKAVWLDDNSGAGGILLIGLDVIGVSRVDIDTVRTRLQGFCRRTGCRSINIMSTHNHETIDTLGPWGELAKLSSGRTDEYMETVFSACISAAEKAYANRTDGKLSYGVIEVEPKTTDNGKYIMGQDDSRFPFEVMKTLARFRFTPEDESKNEIYIVNFAAHAEALISQNRFMSADFPGVMCDAIKQTNGADTLFINGAIGGLVMPGFFYNDDTQTQTVTADKLKASAQILGNAFADGADNNDGYPVLKGEYLDCPSDENTIFIADERQLLNLASAVNEGNTMAGCTVKLATDIDLTGVQFAPIGTLEKRFRGCFDGCGHRITGLSINGGKNTGFFSTLGKGATVANLSVEGFVTGGNCTGAIVGYADKETLIANCASFICVNGASSVGGIVGHSEGRVMRCKNCGEVNAYGSECGGIVGLAENTKVDSCYNRGTIRCKDIRCAGICGKALNSTVENCYNSALIYGLMCRNVCQIVGIMEGESKVRNCLADSTVSICPAVPVTRLGNDGELSVYEQMERYGNFLAEYACAVEDRALEAKINIVSVEDKFSIKNTVLTIAALSGLINNKAAMVRRNGKKAPSLALKTGLRYIKIGDVKLLLLPGEIFTELVTGNHLDDNHAGNPSAENPMPLFEIFSDEGLRIFGLSNDEVGYIIPPNDFVLNNQLPYINPGRDRNGKIHYEETNSLGPETALRIAKLAKLAVEAMK